MTDKKQYNNAPDIDAAWLKLHGRIETDGLLTADAVRPKRSIHPKIRIWAAAAAVALIALAGIFRFVVADKQDKPLIALQNSDKSNTLVKTLDDGSTVYLAANTTLAYPGHFDGNRREVRLEGNAMFDIAHNPQKPFCIDTRQIRVEVLGTAFNIRSENDNAFQLNVLRGKVRISDKATGKSVIALAGQKVTFDGLQLRKSAITDESVFDAYTNSMAFKDEPLDNIVRVINRYSAKKINLEDPAIGQRRLNVRFHNHDAVSLGRIIALALHLKCNVTDNAIVISQP
jgi:ferric-dicitrate binding protein FerR (iron transport regulator)